MSRSSPSNGQRGQTEPLAALVAVSALIVGIGLYGLYLTDTLPGTTDRTTEETAVTRIKGDIETDGVVRSSDHDELETLIETESLPHGRNVYVQVTVVDDGRETVVADALFGTDGQPNRDPIESGELQRAAGRSRRCHPSHRRRHETRCGPRWNATRWGVERMSADRAVSTVMDVAMALLLISASVLLIGIHLHNSGDKFDENRADRTAELLGESTISVQYSLEDAEPIADREGSTTEPSTARPPDSSRTRPSRTSMSTALEFALQATSSKRPSVRPSKAPSSGRTAISTSLPSGNPTTTRRSTARRQPANDRRRTRMSRASR